MSEPSSAVAPRPGRFTGVVFDLDGTLVDSRRDIVHAVEVALSRHGIRPPAEDVIATFVGDGARHLVSRTLAAVNAEAPLEPVLATYLEYYEAHPVEHTTPMPDTFATLDALAHLPLAVCTNKPRSIAERVLEELGLRARFASVVGGGDTQATKPAPGPLLRVARELAAEPSRLVMVGDGVQDIACGRAAGAYTAAVLGGFSPVSVLRSAAPDLLISNLSELAPALLRAVHNAPGAPPKYP